MPLAESDFGKPTRPSILDKASMNMLVSTAQDEFVVFHDEDAVRPVPDAVTAWKVLVVDDDPEVHQATTFALKGLVVCGRPLALLHARSAEEAMACLEATADVAVVFLDVVMENHDSGLALVPRIRKELGLVDTRIILRTGQPGYAPELNVIRDYDINDYRTKSELTHTRLITTLTAAIRSYDQIRTLNDARRGLQMLVETGNQLFIPRDSRSFAEAALGHIEGLFGHRVDAAFCGPVSGSGGDGEQEALGILAATGALSGLIGRGFDALGEQTLAAALRKARAQRAHIFDESSVCLYLGRVHGKEALVYLDLSGSRVGPLVRQLIEILCANLRVSFENVVLFERLHFFAYFDPLTKLPNRTRFLDRLDEGLAGFAREHWTVGIIDIVRFSELNDALGHRSGDLLLTEVTRRLKARLGTEALVARVAGDAFGICWCPEDEETSAVLDVFSAPFVVRGHAVPMRARAGFAHAASLAGGAVELLKRANLALSHAKLEGDQHWRFFNSEMEANTQSRVQLLNELRSALHLRKGLELHYQPQVSPQTGRIVGCEALIRWVKPQGESVAPDVFIPLAEYTGLIVEIGDWVFSEACRQIVQWDQSGLPAFRVGINISAAQFREADFVTKISSAIERSGVDPVRLELEITESVAMEDPDSVARQLRELKALGLKVAVDDFGCGFSSLGSLNRLPFDRIKIDRVFVRELTPSTSQDCIARLIVKLAKSLGLEVIAEGVETIEQARLLEDMGCKEMQGYLYGRPMSAEALEGWINREGAGEDRARA